MKTTLLFKKCAAIFMLLSLSILATHAAVLFETNFQATEGWVNEGFASSTTGTLLSRTITYNGVGYLIKFNQTQINTTDAASGGCSMGSASIQKDGNADYSKVSSSTGNNGYILLPDFNTDVQITLARSNSSADDRRIAIETSVDGGTSWQVNLNDVAPYLATGCDIFKSPTKIPKGTLARITNHSSKGALKVYYIKIEDYVSDLVPPTPVSYVPDVNSIEITPSVRQVSLTFSEPVKSGGDGKAYVVGNTSGNMLELTSDGLIYNTNTVIIPFSSSFFLNPNETYTVQLEKGCIKDMANNPAELVTWNFTTKVNVSSEKEILSIKIPKMVGTPVIDSGAGTIALQLVAGSDLHNIQPANITFAISPLASIINDYKDFGTGPQTYQVIAEDKSVKNWVITITLADYKVASLPVIYKGSVDNTWQNIVADGWTNLLINPDVNSKMNNYSFYQVSLTQAGHYIQNNFAGGANRVSFRARYGNNTSNYKLDVQESVDGTTWTNLVSYIPSNLLFSGDAVPVLLQPTPAIPDPAPMLPVSGTSLGLRSYPVQPTSQFIRWIYTTRTSTTFYVDDVVIENAPADNVAPTFLSDQPVVSQNYSTNTKSQIVFKLSEAVKVSQDLINKTTGIHVTSGAMDSVLYEPRILTLRSGEVVLTDSPALVDQTQYTVTVPGNALVDLAGNAFAGTTFQFTYVQATGINNQVAEKVTIIRNGQNLSVSGAKSIQIYNTLGSLLATSSKSSISIGNLQRGVYIVRFTTESGASGSSKVLLNN